MIALPLIWSLLIKPIAINILAKKETIVPTNIIGLLPILINKKYDPIVEKTRQRTMREGITLDISPPSISLANI